MFATAWSARTLEEDPGAPFFNESPKYVISGSLETAEWTLVRAVLADGLIDELHLFIYPVARGAGQRLFADSGPATKFTLVGSEAYSNGVVHLADAPVVPDAV